MIISNSTIFVFGLNNFGQCGYYPNEYPKFMSPFPLYFTNSSLVETIALGDAHSLILLSNGNLYTMGRNNYGQLGLGTNSSRTYVYTPTKVEHLYKIIKIFAGHSTSCFIDSEKGVYCFGLNNVKKNFLK